MDAPAIIALVAGAASIIGLVYAVLAWQRERTRRKQLVFHRIGGPPLARSRSLGDYRLQVLFEREGVSEKIDTAYVSYALIANLGREPIRREDIAPANPLEIEVRGATVLTVEIEKQTRSVCSLVLGETSGSEEVSVTPISFDFLDQHDGALIRVLTDGRPDDLDLTGDVIGMPGGPEKPSLRRPKPRWLSVVQTVANTVIFLGPQIGLIYVTIRLTERLLFVPLLYAAIVVLVLSGVLATLLDDKVTPGTSMTNMPKALWPRRGWDLTYPRHRVHHEGLDTMHLLIDELEDPDPTKDGN